MMLNKTIPAMISKLLLCQQESVTVAGRGLGTDAGSRNTMLSTTRWALLCSLLWSLRDSNKKVGWIHSC